MAPTCSPDGPKTRLHLHLFYNNLGAVDASTRKQPGSKSKAAASAKKSTPEAWDNKGKLAGIAGKSAHEGPLGGSIGTL